VLVVGRNERRGAMCWLSTLKRRCGFVHLLPSRCWYLGSGGLRHGYPVGSVAYRDRINRIYRVGSDKLRRRLIGGADASYRTMKKAAAA
jgi:hypothetical protein